jgi:hypothetical protein
MTRVLSSLSLLLLAHCAGTAEPVEPTSHPTDGSALSAAAPKAAGREGTDHDARSPINIDARVVSESGGSVKVEVNVERISPLQLPLRASIDWPAGMQPVGPASVDLPPVQTAPSTEHLVFEATGKLPAGRVTVTVAGRTDAAGYSWKNEVDANGMVVPPARPALRSRCARPAMLMFYTLQL